MSIHPRATLVTWISLALAACAQAQGQSPTPAQTIHRGFDYINRKLLDMAKDFPENKYGFRLKPEMRSFGPRSRPLGQCLRRQSRPR
jgi:hypothetical protein